MAGYVKHYFFCVSSPSTLGSIPVWRYISGLEIAAKNYKPIPNKCEYSLRLCADNATAIQHRCYDIYRYKRQSFSLLRIFMQFVDAPSCCWARIRSAGDLQGSCSLSTGFRRGFASLLATPTATATANSARAPSSRTGSSFCTLLRLLYSERFFVPPLLSSY